MGYVSDIDKADRIVETEEFPRVILLDNCNACNLRCSMCDHVNVKKYRKIQNMEMALYKRIVDEISVEKPDVRLWEIFFGDPFLCKDISERVRYAKDKGLKDVVLNSNGVLMTPEKSEEIIDSGLDAMYVGIDASNAETYNQIRVGGKYEKTVENVLAYRDLLAKKNGQDQKLFVQFVVSDINEKQVDDFKEFWSNRGVNVKIRPKISWAGLVEASNLKGNSEVVRKPCYWVMQTMNICADGKLTLCSVDIHCRVPCGNVADSSIKELWQNGDLATYRAMHNEERFSELPEMCQNCSDWQSAYAEFTLAEKKE